MTIKELSDKTTESYSFDRYTRTGWNGAIRVLRSKGLNDREVQAFLRSKHMRWAGDLDCTRTYGDYNDQTVWRYITKDPRVIEKKELDELVEGTFGNG